MTKPSRPTTKHLAPVDVAFTKYFIDGQKSLGRALLLMKHNQLPFLCVTREGHLEIVDFVTVKELDRFFNDPSKISHHLSVDDYILQRK